jgi:hypothetical protein
MSPALDLQTMYQGIREMEQCTWIPVGTLLPKDSPNATKWTSEHKDKVSRFYDDAVNKFLFKYSEFVKLPPSSDVLEANKRIIKATADLKDAKNRLKSASDTVDAVASFLEIIDSVITLIAPFGIVDPRVNIFNTFATSPEGEAAQELPYTQLMDIVTKSYLLASAGNIEEMNRLLILGYTFRLHKSILIISSMGYSRAAMLFVTQVNALTLKIQISLETGSSISQTIQGLKMLMEACEAVVVYHP